MFKYCYKLILTSLLFSPILMVAQKQSKEITDAVYLTANTGLEKNTEAKKIFEAIVKQSKEDDNATLLVLGNITRKVGYPKNDDARKDEEDFLTNNLLQPTKDFNGNIIYIPGKNEWNKQGHKAIDDLESFLQDNSRAKFWPNDGCPIEGESLSDNVELIMVDSQWYLEDWDDHPYINNKCEYRSREALMVEFKDELKDNQGKTKLVAVHHPILDAEKKGFFGNLGGFTNQDYYSRQMQELVGRLETLASEFPDVIFVSGNSKNLQFLSDDGIPQIISGASGKTTKTKPEEEKGFYGRSKNGYAKFIAYADGSSEVEFYILDKQGSATKDFSKVIQRERPTIDEVEYHDKSEFGKTYAASVYTDEEVRKSGLWKSLWGDHYREVYGKKINAPVLFLDTLPNNPKAISEGGGNQSRSLRLLDDEDHEYTIRELRKSAVRFIQSNIKDHYVVDYMKNTIAEDVVQDYYTTAHPYAPFTVAELSEPLGILHANPKMYYIPKQKNLGRFNDAYGDKLYMLEEHVGDENKSFKDLGNGDDILSTADMLLELQEDKDVKIDEKEYIKARIFDMLIGDWDRHADQWRWAEYEKEDGTKIYQTIPRDRDQAFPKYDGFLVGLLKIGVPALRVMQSFEEDIKNTKWFNNAAYPLDKNFINKASWEEWKQQAEFIQRELTNEKIDEAFANLPDDVKDETTSAIKETLKKRKDNLVKITKDYYDYFKKFETVIGTNEDNKFTITRKNNGITEIKIEEDGKEIFSNSYKKDETNEIWVYGLDGDDEFYVKGDGEQYIKLKILGGEENDIYDFKNKRSTKVYDYRSKKNTLKNVGAKRLTDAYETNRYNPKKYIYNTNVALPSIGFDPDAGFKTGVTNTFTKYGLIRNPFSAQHTVSANFFAATSGFEFTYYGEFAHIFNHWNLGIDARYTSPNYAINFFGVGNETNYDDDAVDMDFNRVRISQWHIAPSLIYKKSMTVSAYLKPMIESHEVDYYEADFISDFFPRNNDIYEAQMYAGAEVGINFNNKGSLIAFPRRGMEFGLKTGYKASINGYDNKFGYLSPTVSLIIPLHDSGVANIATNAEANFIFGNEYEFYHAATVGGNNSLRGFRNERFLGKSSYFQSTDLRVGITKFRTNFVPIRLGITGGFDYGRVWNENEDSDKWHSSYGGSVFINGFNAFTANVGYYLSDEDQRLIFTLGFRF